MNFIRHKLMWINIFMLMALIFFQDIHAQTSNLQPYSPIEIVFLPDRGRIVDLSAFPEIRLSFLMRQNDAFVSKPIDPSNLELFEDGREISVGQILEPQKQPITLIILFDVTDSKTTNIVTPEIPDDKFEDLLDSISVEADSKDQWIFCSVQFEDICTDSIQKPHESTYEEWRKQLLDNDDIEEKDDVDFSAVLRTALSQAKSVPYASIIIVKQRPESEIPYITDSLMTELLLSNVPITVVNLAQQNDNTQFLIDMRSRLHELGGDYFCNLDTECGRWENELGNGMIKHRPYVFTLSYHSHLFKDSNEHFVQIIYHDGQNPQSLRGEAEFRFLITHQNNNEHLSSLHPIVKTADFFLSLVLLFVFFIVLIFTTNDLK